MHPRTHVLDEDVDERGPNHRVARGRGPLSGARSTDRHESGCDATAEHGTLRRPIHEPSALRASHAVERIRSSSSADAWQRVRGGRAPNQHRRFQWLGQDHTRAHAGGAAVAAPRRTGCALSSADWVPAETELFRSMVTDAVATEGWVIDPSDNVVSWRWTRHALQRARHEAAAVDPAWAQIHSSVCEGGLGSTTARPDAWTSVLPGSRSTVGSRDDDSNAGRYFTIFPYI